MLLVRARVRAFPASAWLDGLVGALGADALAVALALGEVLQATGGRFAVVATNLAYPVGDLVLLATVLVVFALSGWRPGRAWWLLGIGLVLFVVCDTAYLFETARGSYRAGTPLDSLWALPSVLTAFAAWSSYRAPRDGAETGWSVVAVPAAFLLSSVGVLAGQSFGRVSRVAVLLAAAAVLAASLRAALTFREVRALAESRREARTDDLTGLPNRRFYLERLTAAVRHRPAGQRFAVAVIDLDRFKEVNDSLGHHVGDELLRLVRPRLVPALGTGQLLARIGGDEFGLLLPGSDVAGALALAEELRAQLREPFTVAGVTLHIGASVGVAACPDHGADEHTLLRRADAAMYAAKSRRVGVAGYDEQRDGRGRDQLELAEALRRALTAGELVLHYQPKLDLGSGRMVGVEALVRWQHPERGRLYPDAFLDVAEQSDLMAPLTRAVVDLALGQLREWWDDGVRLTVAVNLSPSTLIDAASPDWVLAAMAAEAGPLPAQRVPAGRLVVRRAAG